MAVSLPHKNNPRKDLGQQDHGATPLAQWKPALIFYGAIPLLTAFVFGVNHSGSAKHMTAMAGTVWWLGIIAILWVLLDGFSRIAHRLASHWSLPRWGAIALATIVAMIAFDPFLDLYSRWTFPMLAPGIPYVEPNSALDLAHSSPTKLFSLLVVPLYWLTCLFVSERLLDFPGYLTEPAGADPVVEDAEADEIALPEPQQGLFTDVPIGIGTNVISIHAEDHYVRVVTSYGEALVRYRFSDALQELAMLDGAQIHRSHWVRVGAIHGVRNEDGRKQLALSDGRLLPVSRSYVGVLRALGHG